MKDINPQEFDEMCRVITIEHDLLKDFCSHTHSEQYSIVPKGVPGDVCQRMIDIGVGSGDVNVYLYWKSTQHPLCQQDIVICETALLHWVKTLLDSHKSEPGKKGSRKGKVGVLKSPKETQSSTHKLQECIDAIGIWLDHLNHKDDLTYDMPSDLSLDSDMNLGDTSEAPE